MQHHPHGQPPHGAYQPPPAHAHAHGAQPPQQPPKKKGGKLLIIIGAAAVVFFLLLVVAGVGGWFLYQHFTAQGLPLDAKQMPKDSTGVMERPYSHSDEKDEKKRKLYMAASLGSDICVPDATSPVISLELAGKYSLQRMMTEENLKKAHQVMKCGTTLVDKLSQARDISLTFKDGEDRMRVSFLELDMGEMPKGMGHEKHKFGTVDGYCFPTEPEKKSDDDDDDDKKKKKGEKDKKECHENAFASFKAGSRWVLGRRKAVDIVAKSVAEPSEELSSSVEFLEQAAAATKGLTMRLVVLMDETVKEPLEGFCKWGAQMSAGKREDFMKACFPEDEKLKKPIEALDAKVRAIAMELDADLSQAEGIRGRMVFVARDEDEAVSLEKELQEIAREWGAHISNNESKLGKIAADEPETSKEKIWRAAVQAYIRGLRGMTVSRSGSALILDVDEKFKDSEKKEIKQAAEETGDEEKAVLAILEELVKGTKISEAKLAKLTGTEWAKWLLMPKVKLKTEECTKIETVAKSAEISDLYGDDVTDEMRSNVNKWKYGVSMVCEQALPKTYRDCVTKAADWRALAACKPPEEPSAEFGPPDKDKKKKK